MSDKCECITQLPAGGYSIEQCGVGQRSVTYTRCIDCGTLHVTEQQNLVQIKLNRLSTPEMVMHR